MIKRENVQLKDYTTFKTGGVAKHFIEVENKEEIKEAILFAKENRYPVFVLGGGSDILMSDAEFDGVVIRYVGKGLRVIVKGGSVLLTADAGMVWDDLVDEAVKRKLQGIESLSGIPGTVGAAPIQNIGAYGQELKDTFVTLTAYDIEKENFVEFSNKDCEFGYRESFFKKPQNWRKFVITDITLSLHKDKKPQVKYSSLINFLKEKGVEDPNLSEVREAVLALRGAKLEDPKVIANAGSFFKNPIIDKRELDNLLTKYMHMPFYETTDGKAKLFSGWLIEESGWKGRGLKGAKVSDKNALVITNPDGTATAKEIRELAEAISKDVFDKFGVNLEPEVQFINFS